MKLMYQYKLATKARNDSHNSQNSLHRMINNHEVEFVFDDEHNVVGLNVFIPSVNVKLDNRGFLSPSPDVDNEARAYSIVSYISNLMSLQIGQCNFTRDTGASYIAETEREENELKKVRKYGASESRTVIAYIMRPRTDLSQAAIDKYLGQEDGLAMYVDATQMNNPTGKFREFFRVMEHYFGVDGPTLDDNASTYLIQFDPGYTENFLYQLRMLRNRCSHEKRHRDYITTNDIKGIKEIKDKIMDMQKIAKLLIDNPPP